MTLYEVNFIIKSMGGLETKLLIHPKSPKIMNETNIWLDKEDKNVLIKKAQSKQLSLSTYIDIITRNYWIICHEKIFKAYIHKGKEQTHIKLLNRDKHKLTPTIITNCVYLFLHPDKLTNYTDKLQITKINRKIQSDTDKTIDRFYLGNQIIRANYLFKGAK